MTSYLSQLLVVEGSNNLVACIYPEGDKWGLEISRHNPSNSNPYRFSVMSSTDTAEQLLGSAEEATAVVEDYLLRNLLEYRARDNSALAARLTELTSPETLLGDMRALKEEFGLEIEVLTIDKVLQELRTPRQSSQGSTVFFYDGWQATGYQPAD